MSLFSHKFAAMDGGYGFYLEAAPGHPGLIALASPWDSAEQHGAFMRESAHMADLLVLTRDRVGGRLTVDRGGHTRLDYRLRPETIRHLRQGLGAAIRASDASASFRPERGSIRQAA